MSHYQYPLNLRFKLVALAPRIIMTDGADREILFVNQKILNLREDVRIYLNQSKQQEVFRIRADRIIDFSATYNFINSSNEQPLGRVKRKGMRSLWRATYYVDNPAGQQTHHIKEDNPWIKMMDALLGEVPYLSLLTGFFFNPTYTVYRGVDRTDETQPIMKLKKRASFFESTYNIELVNPQVDVHEEFLVLLSLMMMIQLERRRG